MFKLKRSVDVYFGLDEVTVGSQFLFYGTIGLMAVSMITGIIGGLI